MDHAEARQQQDDPRSREGREPHHRRRGHEPHALARDAEALRVEPRNGLPVPDGPHGPLAPQHSGTLVIFELHSLETQVDPKGRPSRLQIKKPP